MGVLLFALMVVAAACAASDVRAQTGPASGADAMPQLATIGVAQAKAGAWGLAASGGFGVLPQAAGDHSRRLLGSIAGAATIVEGIALGLRLDGHYDQHPADARGDDDSLAGAPTLRARLATDIRERYQLGADIAVMAPGEDAPSIAFDALRVDARVLASYFGQSAWGIAANTGFRFDKSGNSAPDPASTRAGDRLSLGLNDFHALLFGLGTWKRLGNVELLGEVTCNPWLGAGAPSTLQAPLHLIGGARYFSHDSVAWELLIDGLLSQRPQPAGDRLAAIDPRFSVLLGVRFTSNYASKRAAVETEAPVPTAVVVPVATTATVRGRVTGQDGSALADVDVRVLREGFEGSARTDANGAYVIDDVPLGPATLHLRGRRLQPIERPLEVVAAGVATDAQLERTPPQGQLRGLIRSFDGKPLAAEVTITPTDQTLRASATGEFELGLPPGEYRVRIAIGGYSTQSRTVQIEDDGVTLLNADLKRGQR